MHVICNDGTTIQCQDFEATDSGVLFFQETPGRRESEEDDEEDDEERSADGFVPVTELRFVLPDEMVRQAGGQPAGVPQSGAGGAPPGAQQGGMAQQQMQQSHGAPPQRRPPDSGGR